MTLSLMEVRRYAIDNRAEIKFRDPNTGQECVVNGRGQCQLPGSDKAVSVDEIFAAAVQFEMLEGGKQQRRSRAAMAEAIAAALKKRGVVAVEHEDD